MHTTVITKYEKLSNGQFAMTIRCCNDPATEYVHTMAVSMDSGTFQQSIADARERTAALHKQAQDAESIALEHVGVEKQH